MSTPHIPGPQPKLSIITATYNAGQHIPELSASIAKVPADHVEWVVIDGGSRDGTVEFLRQQAVAHYLLSEADAGIYDAMNKGVRASRGQYLLFLGADDRLIDGSIERLLAAIDAQEQPADIVLGKVELEGTGVFTSRLGWLTNVINSVHHQGALYARSLFADFRYRTDVPVVADYELNFLAFRRGVTTLKTDVLIAYCGGDGISRTTRQIGLYRSMHRLRRSHLGQWESLAYLAIGLTNVARRKVFP